MDDSTTASVSNGGQPTKPDHKFSLPTTTDASLAQQRVHSYMAASNGGGDPVTALGVRDQNPLSSRVERVTQVFQNVDDSMAKYRSGDQSSA
ncbi:hypothetical protein EKO27_g5458 [Xylaria grammica]|uniref:Uncharacterized protein n=1 Tax=Xylaria grammica TaxID=363999 RepID=A0A439D5I7_9PEZI|nr:hypothetical protein EKO27_g5458 [Xylaria grammica]